MCQLECVQLAFSTIFPSLCTVASFMGTNLEIGSYFIHKHKTSVGSKKVMGSKSLYSVFFAAWCYVCNWKLIIQPRLVSTTQLGHDKLVYDGQIGLIPATRER
jgi:hypothetical protein